MLELAELKSFRKKLLAERKLIDSSLETVDSLIHNLNGANGAAHEVANRAGKRKVGQRTWTDAQKREASKRMSKVWEEKKAKSKRAARKPASKKKAAKGASA